MTHLPIEPVVTRGVCLTQHFIDQLCQGPGCDLPRRAGIIFGEAGLGKTVAARTCLPTTDQGGTARVMLTLPIDTTPSELVQQLAFRLGDNVSARRARVDPLGTAVRLVTLDEVQGIIVDDAESLNRKTLALITALRGASPVTVVFLVTGQTVGRLLDDPHDERLAFPAPTPAEIMDAILPAVRLPGWTYDPTTPADRELAEYLWSQVRPSLRALRLVLQVAGGQAGRIDRAAIAEVVRNLTELQIPD